MAPNTNSPVAAPEKTTPGRKKSMAVDGVLLVLGALLGQGVCRLAWHSFGTAVIAGLPEGSEIDWMMWGERTFILVCCAGYGALAAQAFGRAFLFPVETSLP